MKQGYSFFTENSSARLLNGLGEDVSSVYNIINYTCWSDTEIFADKCAGVYCEVHIKVAKESNCATY